MKLGKMFDESECVYNRSSYKIVLIERRKDAIFYCFARLTQMVAQRQAPSKVCVQRWSHR